MSYIKYTINTTTVACDDICYYLTELGITALEIEDGIPCDDVIQGKNYSELMPKGLSDDGKCNIIFYLDEPNDSLLSSVRQAIIDVSSYTDVGAGTVESEAINNDDYLNQWKEYFHSFCVGDLYIKPTWETSNAPTGVDKVISIDPGIAFGTGAHDTTKLCIEGIQKYLQLNDNVLDLGFGSGILDITALLYGAKHVTGTDIDPVCIDVANDNLAVNNIDSDKCTFHIGDITGDKTLQAKVGTESFDIIVANILADIIMPMASVMHSALKSGGTVITSGIIDFKEAEVAKALSDVGLKITEIKHLGEWVSIVATKE